MQRVDLIVPTIAGREASLERCLTSFARSDVNPIVVTDSPTCGEGWIEGLRSSTAPYVALVADDLECVGDRWVEVCVETADRGLLPCPRVWTPMRTIESQGGDMNAVGHILARHTRDQTEVDFTTVPFCSREQIDAIGMIPTQYGCDTWISYRGRQLGYRTVLRHGYDLVHHQEQVGRGAGMSQGDRDAMDIATMREELARLDEYASHVPVLELVLGLVRPRRVLELGAGAHSTPLLAGHPGVEELVSVETDERWLPSGDRVTAVLTQDTVEALDAHPPGDFDLVFIDNADNATDRERAIRAVLSKEHPPTVIHDAEDPQYQAAIEELAPDHLVIRNALPATAVCW